MLKERNGVIQILDDPVEWRIKVNAIAAPCNHGSKLVDQLVPVRVGHVRGA